MIPRDQIAEWRQVCPWPTDGQVEQDLLICRAVVAIFGDDMLRREFAFRGGTAINKLYLAPALRYSEDIDLVKMGTGPTGAALWDLQSVLDPWLGSPAVEPHGTYTTLRYTYAPTGSPRSRATLKIEVNTSEPMTVFGLVDVDFDVRSRYFTGAAPARTYALDELYGTKLRALLQRNQGRDLFDL